jgi:hypothetical protein
MAARNRAQMIALNRCSRVIREYEEALENKDLAAVLAHHEGLTYADIARAMRTSNSQAKRYVTRGLRIQPRRDPPCSGPGYAHAPHGDCPGYATDRT